MIDARSTKQAIRILVVDDEPGIRKLLAAALGQEFKPPDYELLDAPDGAAAKAVLSAGPVDIVVTDLIMPQISGLDLLRWGQEHLFHNGLAPTWIILSGQGILDDAIQAIRLGAFNFVCKTPEMVDSLLVTVHNALHLRQLNSERAWLEKELESRNERLADQVAQLREQAEIIEEDLGRAELIQRSLLPCRPPAMGNFSADAIYRPSHNVGGDLYDVVRLDDHHVGFYVADATGHGVAAAVLTVLFKKSLSLTEPADAAGVRSRGHAEPQPPSPSPLQGAGRGEGGGGGGTLAEPRDVLRRVNDRLIEECEAPGMFITAVYGRLNTETGQVVIASAGHPPALLSRTSRPVEMIYRTGPALGLFASAQFSQASLVLEPGDQLLLYTDGLCLSAGDRNSTVSQIAALFDERQHQGQALLGRLLELASNSRGGGPQEDDITLLLLTCPARQGEAQRGPAAASMFDNGQPRAVAPAARPARVAGQSEILIGSLDGATVISILGGGRWMQAREFHQACITELKSNRALIVDLSSCTQLDSTFLGTIQEIVAFAQGRGGSVRFQGLLAEVRGQFEELGMDAVLERISRDLVPLPGNMAPLVALGRDEFADRWRLVLAHEALALLNERNHHEFVKLIERLRAGLPERELAGRR